MATLQEEAELLRELKTRSAGLTKTAKALAEEYKIAEAAFIDRCDRENTTTLGVGTTLFVPTTQRYGDITDKDEFVAWATENAPELVDLTPRKAVVNETVRLWLDNGDQPPPGMDFRKKRYVSMRTRNQSS